MTSTCFERFRYQGLFESWSNKRSLFELEPWQYSLWVKNHIESCKYLIRTTTSTEVLRRLRRLHNMMQRQLDFCAELRRIVELRKTTNRSRQDYHLRRNKWNKINKRLSKRSTIPTDELVFT